MNIFYICVLSRIAICTLSSTHCVATLYCGEVQIAQHFVLFTQIVPTSQLIIIFTHLYLLLLGTLYQVPASEL